MRSKSLDSRGPLQGAHGTTKRSRLAASSGTFRDSPGFAGEGPIGLQPVVEFAGDRFGHVIPAILPGRDGRLQSNEEDALIVLTTQQQVEARFELESAAKRIL